MDVPVKFLCCLNTENIFLKRFADLFAFLKQRRKIITARCSEDFNGELWETFRAVFITYISVCWMEQVEQLHPPFSKVGVQLTKHASLIGPLLTPHAETITSLFLFPSQVLIFRHRFDHHLIKNK